MSERRAIIAVGLLSIALVVGAVGVPAIASGRPANQIPVEHAPGEADALDTPQGDAWVDVEAVSVPLSSAPSGLPNAADVATDSVTVKAARTDSTLFVRLEWTDPSKNDSVTDSTDFADAVAMQLPAETGTHPGIALGSQDTMVNVWYWSATGDSQEIIAGGPGTITETDGTISTASEYSDDTWTVVFARDLTVDGENRAQIEMEHDVDTAFAVWNGANGERSGHHAVSDWYHYPLGPQPEGPPFATLLWTVAGIVIVAIVMITVLAVRRTS